MQYWSRLAPDQQACGSAVPLRGGSDQPSVGIIIPAYGHSEYVADALASAAAQEDVRSSIVIVVDGCPHSETYLRTFAWASACDNVSVLVKRNAGLSAARNSGIEFLRSTQPGLEFVYFLDADNSLAPGSLSAAAQKLRASPEEIAWAYPDINTVGVYEENPCPQHYSRLAHLVDNISEAGSLVRAETLWKTGVRFDEAMRSGYEDWDFWLQLMSLGYKGVHCAELVFYYRRRPASMLASSRSVDDELRAYIRRKHKRLYDPINVLAFDREDAPRYLSYLVDAEEFILHHNPAAPTETFSVSECAERLLRHSTGSGAAVPIGVATAFTTSAAYSLLCSVGLAGALLHRIERLLTRGAALVSVSIVDDDDSNISIRELDASEPVTGGKGHLHAISQQLLLRVLNDRSTQWLAGTMFEPDRKVVKFLRVNVPKSRRGLVDLPDVGPEALLYVCFQIRASGFLNRPIGADEPPRVWGHVQAGETAGWILKSPPPYNNALPGDRPVAAFTVPISEFGGAERVVHQFAKVLRDRGFYTQLFIVWDEHAGSTRLLSQAFDEIVPLGLGSFEAHSGVPYFGTSTCGRAGDSQYKLDEIYSCLVGADVVINCHVAWVHALASRLRRQGILTIADLHCFDLTPNGRPVGHPYLIVGYEHGYDRIAVPTKELKHKLLGLGVPSGKILLVRNSVGVPEELLPGDRPARKCQPVLQDGRRELKCLFVGRLDQQKGLDRLVNLIRIVQARHEPVTWTVIGGSVLKNQDSRNYAEELLELGVLLKPAIHEEQRLVEELSDADVLVLPSYWEGMPLILAEAMRLGILPVATRVGGIAEFICDGVNGFIVPSDGHTEFAIADAIARIARMPSADFDRLRQAAIADASALNWATSTAPLVEALERHVTERNRDAQWPSGTPAAASNPTRVQSASVAAAE